jgi:alanine racemase
VRPGIALYGLRPDPAQEFGIDLRPIARLVASVVKVKQVPAGTPISYGGTYVTPQPTTIATVELGYAQGLPRALSNRGSVLIGGKRYRIAGRVTMDYIMIDVGSQSSVAVGDEVVAMGCQGSACISPDEVGQASGTIGYEILCHLNTRVDRYYYRNGQMVQFVEKQPY